MADVFRAQIALNENSLCLHAAQWIIFSLRARFLSFQSVRFQFTPAAKFGRLARAFTLCQLVPMAGRQIPSYHINNGADRKWVA